jgi:hypothetical protein
VSDGRLAGLWRTKAGKVTVEKLGPLPAAALEAETERVAELLRARASSR